tara:strand:+ start:1597 stop:2700 length:1104 start_codon:yes stop_codon:yes gene_type:complete
MGVFAGPEINEDGLVLALDAANTKSYPGSGTTWNDLSGKENDGTISGATHTSGVGGYFDFDGSNDYVSHSNDSFVSNGGATLECWFNVDTLSADRALINHSGFSYFNLLRTSNNKLRLEYKSTLANNTQLFTTSTISAERWYHIVGVVDSTGARIYIDGELDASNTTPQNLGTVSSTLYVGAYSTSQYRFDGKIAMVKRYDKPLTAAEVKQNYNALRTREFLNPLPESFWEHTTNYYQPATATVFPSSWYPASSSGACADATVGPTFSPSRSGTQSFYHTGGAGSRVCIEESTDGGSTWTNIIDNNTQTTTFTLTYVGGRKYRFKMNVLGGPGAGAGVQVLNWHYTYTSPSNYRVMGIRSAHTDTNG